MVDADFSPPDVRAWIRGIPALTGTPPPAPEHFPENPGELFLDWLRAAVAFGVVEPHVCALSTVDGDGMPDSRFLILKDVTEGGFWFSGSAASPKGIELKGNPRASLAFYWRETGQQVRIRGLVHEGDDALRRRDFVERSVTARAVATASKQSEVLEDFDAYDTSVAAAEARIGDDPGFVSKDWRAWCVEPESVEFWQADSGRRHQRWLYGRGSDRAWRRSVLWP
ncbi:pyridoxal 5'-phosphate synthase [Rhodococcus erythropolis]|uniref:pyridoxine/pyridoxamine 5'-phosphate oxidase n=1 Tax=Rhodococcus erythropolis TaxID=1833 RepID=UPI001E2CF404|nr:MULTISPECIES: pyridoxal 5'-phosphate synthase [Rhodococcus erythropolis group]MCD2105356.1 pyridoxal 5'-phosphate synthase [Rhodococcus qingshengii]MCZ4524040.1 pyridoxal 5'-phosphate synthase [Rhodococcus erythropolis]